MGTGKVEDSPFNQMRINNAPNGQASLTYLRVMGTDCDLYREKATCWEQLRKKLGVQSTQAPVCSGYQGVTTRLNSSIHASDADRDISEH
jgi:hypothetical protein